MYIESCRLIALIVCPPVLVVIININDDFVLIVKCCIKHKNIHDIVLGIDYYHGSTQCTYS